MGELFKLQLLGGWIFTIIFYLINRVLLAVYPKHFSKRFYERPAFKSKKEYGCSAVYGYLLNITMVYAIFTPITKGSPKFIFGIAISIVSLILYTIALINYASTPPDQPVVSGVYKISRHPQQVLTEIFLIGCGFAASSWIIVLSCLIQIILLYQSMKVQERDCALKFGRPYEEYIQKTPRFFLIF